jgi:hypothetical protein
LLTPSCEKHWGADGGVAVPPAQVKSLQEFPPRQAADTLSVRKAIEETMTMKKLDSPAGSSNGERAPRRLSNSPPLDRRIR